MELCNVIAIIRGYSTGIYTTNSPKACLYCAEQSKANIIVVQDDKQAEKIQEIKSQLPLLKAIVQYEGEPKYPDILSVSFLKKKYRKTIKNFTQLLFQWEKLLKLGREQNDTLLEKRLSAIAVNECCSIVFTVSYKLLIDKIKKKIFSLELLASLKRFY